MMAVHDVRPVIGWGHDGGTLPVGPITPPWRSRRERGRVLQREDQRAAQIDPTLGGDEGRHVSVDRLRRQGAVGNALLVPAGRDEAKTRPVAARVRRRRGWISTDRVVRVQAEKAVKSLVKPSGESV